MALALRFSKQRHNLLQSGNLKLKPFNLRHLFGNCLIYVFHDVTPATSDLGSSLQAVIKSCTRKAVRKYIVRFQRVAARKIKRPWAEWRPELGVSAVSHIE